MRKLYFTLFLSGISFLSYAQPVISYQSFLSGFTVPIEIVNAGDNSNRLFIVQQNGIIRVYDPANGGLQATNFLDISSIITYVGDERGLLSMAFHPLYATNGYFFVYYNNASGNVSLARYHISANRNVADASSGVVLFTITKPFTNHNGCHLQFREGNLYMGTGDGGSGYDPNNNAQTGTSLLGKVLRVNVDNFTTAPYYTVPTTNPFYGNASYDNRVWALGLRNPFRWSFDRSTGDMWIGDVGQNVKEEIDYSPVSSTGGENYGWKCYEGSIHTPTVPTCNPPNYTPPIFDFDNPNGSGSPSCAVIGGYVYRGPDYPFFNGYYIATEYYSGNIYLIKSNGAGGWTTSQQSGSQNFIAAFGEAQDGTLYAASQSTGTVYKVVATSTTLPVVITNLSAKHSGSYNEISWSAATEDDVIDYAVEYSSDGRSFQKAGTVQPNAAAKGNYSFQHFVSIVGNVYYRLAMHERNNITKYSNTVVVASAGVTKIYPTVIRDSKITIELTEPAQQLNLISSNGEKTWSTALKNTIGTQSVSLPSVAKGIYIVQVIAGDKTFAQKVFIE